MLSIDKPGNSVFWTFAKSVTVFNIIFSNCNIHCTKNFNNFLFYFFIRDSWRDTPNFNIISPCVLLKFIARNFNFSELFLWFIWSTILVFKWSFNSSSLLLVFSNFLSMSNLKSLVITWKVFLNSWNSCLIPPNLVFSAIFNADG